MSAEFRRRHMKVIALYREIAEWFELQLEMD